MSIFGLGCRFFVKNAGSALAELPFPVRCLIRVDSKLLREFGHNVFAQDSSDSAAFALHVPECFRLNPSAISAPFLRLLIGPNW